jgi:hypothetical protein
MAVDGGYNAEFVKIVTQNLYQTIYKCRVGYVLAGRYAQNFARPVLLTKYYLGDQIKRSEMGGACST